MNKQPILSDEQIRVSCLGEGCYFAGEWENQATSEPPNLMPQFRNIAQAQRDADLKWLYEEVEQMVIPYMRGSYYYSGAEGFKQQVLALLRGTRKEGED